MQSGMSGSALMALPLQPFKCDELAADKAVIRGEWEKWLRAFEIYAESEDIVDAKKKRAKLLFLGGTQLQEVAHSIPDALVEYQEKEPNDVYTPLIEKLTQYFSPEQNSTFERHVFRGTKPNDGENFDRFLLRVRQSAKR